MISPQLSVVIAAIDDYSIVEQVHLCLEHQTIRPTLELIFVCRTMASLALPDGFREAYPDAIIVEAGDHALLNEAREAGVRRASTLYALIIEDHCLPFPDCLEHMLARLQEGWTAVGPAFVSGNTVSHVGIAANVLTYGQWMGWTEGGPRSFVAGYNSAFAVKVLLARGPRLTDDLIAPSTLQMSLAREGHRFYFEPRARMAHWEASTFEGVRSILSGNGRGLGMLRARHWSVFRKIAVSVLNPLLIAHRVVRAIGTMMRLGERSVAVMLYLPALSALWSLAELRGYWCRHPREAVEGVSMVESNRLRFVDATREPIRKPY
ncbi:MAG: glycosyltransferase [Vicinamibacterales bacterium]